MKQPDSGEDMNRETRPLQFGLPFLFAVITFLALVFAFPKFVAWWIALAVAVVVALLAFFLFVFIPVTFVLRLVSKHLSHRGKTSEAGQERADEAPLP